MSVGDGATMGIRCMQRINELQIPLMGVHGFFLGNQLVVEDAPNHQLSEPEMDNGMDAWNIVIRCMCSRCFGGS